MSNKKLTALLFSLVLFTSAANAQDNVVTFTRTFSWTNSAYPPAVGAPSQYLVELTKDGGNTWIEYATVAYQAGEKTSSPLTFTMLRNEVFASYIRVTAQLWEDGQLTAWSEPSDSFRLLRGLIYGRPGRIAPD